MSIAVTAIAFDHGRGQPGAYTLPLRFDDTQPVMVPEWAAGNPYPSVAAYVRDRPPLTAHVLVRFAVTAGEARHLEIQARASANNGFSPSGSRPLPDLPPLQILFGAAGDSGWCSFTLTTAALSAWVDASTQQWTWQLRRTAGAPWIDFDATLHRTYVVLLAPTAPWLAWSTDPANASLPRTDALDFACMWANGARDVTEAATRITESVNRPGGATLTYDALVGAPHYTVLGVPRFLCDAFLDRARGGEGMGPLVNCSDCARIVSTFANLLGADLWHSKMGLVGAGFRLILILAIGGRQWSTGWGGFSFHEVAWSGACAASDTVYDVCIYTDRDKDPAAAPHTPSLPTNQVFGTAGSAQYRDQLAARGDRDKCAPKPALRIRRPVSGTAIALMREVMLDVHHDLVARAGLHETPPVEDGYFFEGFSVSGAELPGWRLSRTSMFSVATLPRVVLSRQPVESQVTDLSTVQVSIWHSVDKPEPRLRVESVETASSADARQALIRVAGEIECPLLKRWENSPAGEVALNTPDGALAVFTRGNHLHIIRSAGREPVEVRSAATALDGWLKSAGTPVGEHSLADLALLHWSRPDYGTWRRFNLSGGRAQRMHGGVALWLRVDRAKIVEFVVRAGAAAGKPM